MRQRVIETSSIQDHANAIREMVEVSLSDPETRKLAVALASGSYDWEADPRTGQRIPVVHYHNRGYRVSIGPNPPGICAPRDYRCEIIQVWNFVVLNVRYLSDADGFDDYQDLKTTLEAGGGDCFLPETLLLRDDYQLVPIAHIRPGDRIWGAEDWTTVEEVGVRGSRAVSLVELNNGSTVPLTANHKLYTADGDRFCVEDALPGTPLLTPAKIAFGAAEMDPERALVEGLYLADGWVDGKLRDAPSRFAISGRDGKPKEAQKRVVEGICKRRGISTRWHERYLAVNDGEWAARLARMGHRAAEKRVLDLGLTEGPARALLRGLMADAGANSSTGWTWSSTSRELMVQMRVLLKMCGYTAGYRFLQNHGGLGRNPVHRLGIRVPVRDDGRAAKQLRVKHVHRDVFDAVTWDLKTSDHKVYLPEHDVTVSNCDDFTIAFCALLRSLGYRCYARIISLNGREWAHVYPLVEDPKGRVIALDATEEGKPLGWEWPTPAAVQDYHMGEAYG